MRPGTTEGDRATVFRRTAGAGELSGISFLNGGDAVYLERLLAAFEVDPASVSPDWRAFFAQMGVLPGSAGAATGPSWASAGLPGAKDDLLAGFEGYAAEPKTGPAAPAPAIRPARPPESEALRQATRDSIRALMMIRAYRARGHLHANLDPLGLEQRSDHGELHPATYGFTDEDFDRKIFIDGVLGLQHATLFEIVSILRRTYCGTIGFEFMHVLDPAEKSWLQERIEGPRKEIVFTPQGKRAILNKLIEAEGFEKFLDLKYTGTKRFGLDGGESIVPALEQIIKRGGALGVKEIVLGMAHRGRLNLLCQVMGKPHRALFHEFKGGSFLPDEVEGSGDVKYHLGASSDREFDGNKVHLSLTANPSHLEIVDPVVLGKVRAKQDQHECPDDDRRAVMPLLIHGDAAFAGQGVVAECFGLSGLKGHRTGGSLHFIINNQIGFTTYPRYSRSSPYPSDLAKMVEAPIFHVNGDDPEAVVFAARVATEFRQQFQKPVVIDMWCYRRFGHNEGDEPAFTQPLMYRKIRAHKSTLEIYGEKLVAEGHVSPADLEKGKAEWRANLDAELEASQSFRPNKADWLDGYWSGLKPGYQSSDDERRGKTGVAIETLRDIGRRITVVPPDFNVHKTVQRFMDARRAAIESGAGIDWATAEALAFGSLLREGHRVRLSGQDSERGTFSQRHAVLIDQENESRYVPLEHVGQGEGRFEVINSMLSEEAVLGFEYGYSLADPQSLVLWEAQFGDFANGAQVIFDQFLSAGERKWLRMSGLACLLPHGYEGQGPEHSSARLERYLQLAAEDNLQVANCSTPANYFHILRRQLNRNIRKPLILMAPKSLLRHKRCVSKIEDFGADSTFHRLLPDEAELARPDALTLRPAEEIRRLILCSGKVYYDLLEEREKRGADDVYLLRVEQLYPLPLKQLALRLSRMRGAEVAWCQEEPRNMGAWSYVEPYLEWTLGQAGGKLKRARYVGRPASASTAAGTMARHMAQLRALLDEAFA
jgi:2-oxoglutarate dehydrogenase E1 component